MAESDDVSAIKSRLSAGSIRSIGNEQQANDRIGGTRTTTTSAKEMVAAGPNNNNKTVLNRTEGNGANCRPGQQQLCNMLICIVSISIASCCIWWPSEAQAQYYSPSSGATNHQYATPGSEHLAHFEQQYAAAAAAAAANQQQQHQQQQLSHQSPFPLAFNLISSASKTQQQPIVIESPQSVQPSASGPTAASGGGGSGAGQSRSTRSIGEMFKKLFNANKRSKQSSASSPSASLSSSPSTSRDWEQQQQQHSQQQHQQQQQFQQQQQQNQQAFAAQLAAAAANQHAVYASPYATAAATPGALYAQNPFAAGSYSPSYLTWPTASLAQAFRAPAAAPAAYLTAAQPQVPGGPQAGPPPQMTLTSSGPLFAAASQSYNSYVPAPNPAAQDGRPTGATVGGGGASSGANPVVAASQQHVSAVPAPPSMMNAAASSAHPSMVAPGQGVGRGSGGGGGLNSLDFYQVLDTLVRSSGFAPAGDNEAAYGSKDTDGTPVFSFKKLISMPFYLSTEDKSLDGLAPAGAGGPHQGYLPSMPIMRRHTRRMSTAGQQQQQQQAAASRSSQAASGSSSSSTSPYFIPNDSMASYQQYNTYINALNKQLAAMAASGNQQQQQYIDRHYLDMVAEISQKRPTTLGATTSTHQASTLDAMAADSALSNYYATLSSPNGGSLVGENGASRGALRSSQSMAADRMVASASMNPVVYAQQPPQQQQQPQQQQLQQQQHQGSQQQNQALAQRQSDEIQAIINNLPQLLAENADQQTYMTIPSGPASSFMETGNYRFGSSQPQSQNQQQQQQQQAYKGRLASSTNMVSQQQQGKQASNDLMTLINQSGLSGNNNSQQQPQQQPQQQQQADSNQKDSNQQLSDSTSASLAMSQQQQQLSSQLQQGQQQQVQGDSMQTQPSTMMSQQTAPVAGHHHHHHHHVVHNQMHQQQQGASALAPTPQSQSQASSSSSASTSLAAAAENNGQIVVVNGHHNQANGSPESSAPNQSVTGGSNGNNGASPIGLNQVSPFIGPGSA